MRVGFDARWYNDSGVGSYVAGLLPGLCRAGCDLVVYVDPGKPVPGIERLDAKVVPVSAGRYSPFAAIEFRRRATEDKLDVFHSPFYVAPRLQCPVIITIHDLIPFLFPIYPWPKQQLVKAGYRAAVRRARHIITDSQHSASDIEKILGVSPERITAIHLAAEKEVFNPCAAADEMEQLQKKFGVRQPYIVVASARNWRTKNLDGALRALAIAHKQADMEFQAVVYGPPQGMDALHVVDGSGNLNVQRVGYVRREELAALFRHAHAFVMPSLYEGFGLSLVEAMACGCPVITSNRGPLPEVAGTGAQCFDPLDTDAMVAALVLLLRNTHELEQKKAAAVQRAVDFSWDKTALDTISVYHHVNRQVSSP
ncbi:MAG TPA: glycosyltransferase family 1 protein [Candidatus Angelobacter sp.]|nr:glycosyltransferase family 1 protein [Candidatus Angelobacter sp.]